MAASTSCERSSTYLGTSVHIGLQAGCIGLQAGYIGLQAGRAACRVAGWARARIYAYMRLQVQRELRQGREAGREAGRAHLLLHDMRPCDAAAIEAQALLSRGLG